MPTASARHILVPTKEACEDLIKQIEGGASFAELAQKHSKCPSGQRGGDLGTFKQGQMVPEFDKVVFSAEIGKVQGPVKTDFGYHVIEVTERGESGPSASARHILVPTEDACEALKKEIEGGADFAELAAKHSKCPSGQRGGELGTFEKGQMVPEFDKVVFTAEVGKVHGPVKTDFGYHLIEITKRG